MAKKKKLSNEELDRAVQKVRDRYNDYIIRFMKSPGMKEDFEFRYAQARRVNADIPSFLHAEITVLQELIRREENKAVKRTAPGKKTKGPDFADKIMEQHRKMIEKYPDLDLPENGSFEMKKLFGMFRYFDARYWSDVLKLMRESKSIIGYGTRTQLEAQENALCVPLRNNTPSVLQRYFLLLDASEPDWYAIEKEQKNCILTSAFFLHRTVKICTRCLEKGELEEDLKKRVENVLNFLHSVLTDFRLHDLKPSDLEEF